MRSAHWVCLMATCALVACKGETGATGPKGDPGMDGRQGPPGPAGTWSAVDGGVAASIATTITVNARSDCGSIAPPPHMEVFVDHVRVGGADITSSTFGDVPFTLASPTFVGEVAVVYTNDGNAGGCDHNLYVDHVTLSGGGTISATDTEHVLFDKMAATDLATAFDGIDVAGASPSMAVNGALRFFVGATGHLSGLGDAPAPIFSTKSSATRFANSSTGIWEFTGERITLPAPPERPGRYRIFLRQMFTSASAGMAYCEVHLTVSTATPSTISVPSVGSLAGNPTSGYWQTVSSEGIFQVPAGQTIQLNVSMLGYSGSICQLANATGDGDNYANVIAWPL